MNYKEEMRKISPSAELVADTKRKMRETQSRPRLYVKKAVVVALAAVLLLASTVTVYASGDLVLSKINWKAENSGIEMVVDEVNIESGEENESGYIDLTLRDNDNKGRINAYSDVASFDVRGFVSDGCEMTGFDKKFKAIPKYPAVTRDLSMIMKKEVHADEVEAIISKCGGKLIENFELFDIYEGERIGEGLKSLAYSMAFRAPDRTLEDKDVNPIIEKIIEKLKEKGIELRS